MSVSVLDVAVSFLVDKTATDAAFEELPGKAQASFGQADAFVEKFKTNLDATAENVTFAGEKVLSLGQAFRTLAVTGPDHLKAQLDQARQAFTQLEESGVDAKGTLLQATIKVTERELAYKVAVGESTKELQQKLSELRTEYAKLGGSDAGKKLGDSFHEARGSVDLLSDAIGISIPRELKTLLASLPGVGAALSSAFIPAAVVALIGLLVEAGEKILEFHEKQRQIAIGWEDYRVTVDSTSRSVIEQIQAQEKQIIELTQGPLAALEFGFQHLQTTAFETFKSISSDLDLVKKQIEAAGTGEVFNPFGTKAIEELDAFKVALAQALRAAELAHPEESQAPYAAALDLTATKIQEVTDKIQRMQKAGADAPGLIDPLKAQLLVLNDINTALNQGVELDQIRAKLAQQQVTNTAADDAAKKAKRDLDEQLISIEAWKAGVHAAYVSGATDAATWAAAQVHAADAADLAQENYLKKIIKGYQDAGETQKAQIAIQELATLQLSNSTKEFESLNVAMQKHNEFALQMVKGWADLEAQNVAKTWADATKAAQQLVLVQNKLAESQTNLNLADTAATYARAIELVHQLADAGVISQEKENQDLRTLYSERERDQLDSLNKLLSQQKAVIDEAQGKLDQAKDNPFFSDAQLDQLQENLDKAVIAYTDTETKIANTIASSDAQNASLNRTAAGLRNVIGLEQIYQASLLRTDKGMKQFALSADLAFSSFTSAIGQAFAAAITGQESFAAALRKGLLATYANLAGQSIAYALYYTAHGIADSFWNPGRAGADFAAAAFFAKDAALFGGLAGAVALTPGGGDKGQPGAPEGLPPVQQTAATTAQQNPIQSTNIQRFATGGLVSHQTLAILGDSPGGGNAREIVVPFDDDRVMDMFADRLSERIGAGGTVVNHYHQYPNLKGIIDVNGLMKAQTRAAKKGRGRLTSTDTLIGRRG